MSIPIKHHFLPEFYMRSWADLTGQVVAYGRPYKDVEVKRRYPSEIGFKKELYSIKSRTDPARRQEIESKFMAFVDNQASDALEFLLARNSKPEDAQLRDG